MFRIKTDIRQYKCETKDKVEKLIRNWVIRPSDLIYDADGKEWAPIGEHPAFTSLFGVLDEQEKNTPDTVVTRRSAYEGDNDEAPVNGSAGDGEEVTQLVDRDEIEQLDRDDATPDEVTRLSGRPAVADSEADDARETNVFDQDEIAESLSDDGKPAPPKTPAGVEAPANDGEVTMMTERTLEMLKITDEDEAAETPDDEGEAGEEEEDEEEITGVRDRGETSEAGESDEESDAEDEDEAEVQASDGSEDLKTTAEQVREKVLESGPKLGRHDLPEELFATNEISSPEVQEQLKRLDELGELDPSDPTTTDDEAEQQSGEWPARLEEDSDVDEAWDVIAEDLRTTEELDGDGEAARGEKSDPATAATDELDRDNFDDEWEEETSEPAIRAPKGDFVSDGYKVPLPFPVRPTAEDIRRGMPQGRVSRGVKDRTFPPPEPKKPGEVHVRHFDLSKKPPRDQTLLIFVAVAVLVLIIAIGVASC